MDMGQGVDVAIAQIVAEELDVPFERVSVVMGDTAWTVNQGGASGSTGIQKGGIALRNAAAEARRVLVEMASARLGVPADRLEVTDGVVAVSGDPARKLGYGELIGGRYFDLPMKWNGKLGNDLVAEGQAKPKPPAAYKIVGQSPPRFDVPAKVFGKLDYVTDIKVPGMLHGRMIRPPVAGAVPVAVDEGSVRDIPGVRVVRDKGFLGIVAEREWDAVQAAERLQVTWSEAAPPFPENAALYDHIRQAPVVKREVPVATGEIDPAFAGAARVVEAEYEWPFQSHASMGPACAVVDARADGATLWTGSQKPHFARDGVARALGLPQDKVHGIWVPGPGSYGRNDAGDAGIDAALLSKAVGRPVRVQGMRYEGHGWDPKGPASIHRARAALDKDGAVIGYVFESKGFSRIDIDTNESDPRLQPRRPADGPAAEVAAGLWRARRILRLREQAAGLGDDRAVARPRLAIAHRASARPGRPADPVRQRILHRRDRRRDRRRPGRLPPALSEGTARHRRRQGGGRARQVGAAPLAAARPQRRHLDRARHRLCPALGCGGRDRRRGRDRPPHRQGLGAQIHRRA